MRKYPQHLSLTALAPLLFVAVGCATIKIGGDRTPRFDKDGNEVVFISSINVSRLSGVVIPKNSVVNGVAIGSEVGSGLATVGPGAGMLAGGVIAGTVKAITDSGKLEVNVVDFDAGTETKKARGWDKILRTPWAGWEELRPQTWARLTKDGDGIYVLPCDPACPAVLDSSGTVTPLPPDQHLWVFNTGPREFRVHKTIPTSAAEKFARQWPEEVGTQLLLRVRERDAVAPSLSAKN